MGFEPTRAEPNGLAVHRLNHSATSSTYYENKCESEFVKNVLLYFKHILLPTIYIYRINFRFTNIHVIGIHESGHKFTQLRYGHPL